MRFNKKSSGKDFRYYGIEDVKNENGKYVTRVVKSFGKHSDLLKQDLGGLTPEEWCRQEIERLNASSDEGKIYFSLDSRKRFEEGQDTKLKAAPLLLLPLFQKLKLKSVFKKIAKKHKYEFDLNKIFTLLTIARILDPSSKRATLKAAERYPGFQDIQEHQIYRGLEILAEHLDEIQAAIYKNSTALLPRSTGVLYYDCTNFFFEIDEPSGMRQFGISKEHRPNPIVQMGLFMDAKGIPLAFCIQPGNSSEQVSMKPLEQKLLRDFGCAEFVVCTDAGLSSLANRRFNSLNNRAFITAQSVKTLKKHLKEWALSPEGWRCGKGNETYDLRQLDPNADLHRIFYKERWIKEHDFEQRLIVSYSREYKNYSWALREDQIARAQAVIARGGKGVKTTNLNDCRRFIKNIATTTDGEVAETTHAYLDYEKIAQEAQYDGFYAVCTNLEDDVSDIIRVNKYRWQIERCFRVMKSEFKARPVYLQRDTRIRAHFLTCFTALLIFRILQELLEQAGVETTDTGLLDALRDMELTRTASGHYVPSFRLTPLTRALQDQAGLLLDTHVVTSSRIKKLIDSM